MDKEEGGRGLKKENRFWGGKKLSVILMTKTRCKVCSRYSGAIYLEDHLLELTITKIKSTQSGRSSKPLMSLIGGL